MRGKVTCRFTGGPKGEEILTMSAMECKDRIGLNSDAWIAQGEDGKLTIINKPMPPHAPWVSFSSDIYEKVKPVKPGSVTYKFIRTVEVHRYEKILEDKGRRCREEAQPGTKYCRVHNKLKS